jgi:Kef-type K+ transport system membrane component KefB
MGALFLPLYFTLSGLNTNLGLLDSSITWGYLIAVTIVAFSAKFIGCALAARLNGLVWRESFSIGSLMSCKGLVELIVLNIGLQARILSPRVFTMVSLSSDTFCLFHGPIKRLLQMLKSSSSLWL